MTEQEMSELKLDFLEWSGGFPPESKWQIAVYVEYAMRTDLGVDDVRGLLATWMNSDFDIKAG